MRDPSMIWSKRLCILAGLSDGMTGVGLALMPALTLRLMGIADLPAEMIFIRYIGVFVLAAGLSYGLPFLGRNRTTLRFSISMVFQVTAVIRILVGVVCSYGLLTRQLGPAWISVPVYDLTLAALQLLLLKRELTP